MCEAVVIVMNVCVGGEEQPESHLEDVHGSSADVLQQRPGKASKGSTLKKTFLFETSASVLTWSHGISHPSVQVDCHDYDSDGSHDLIGSFTTKVSELQKAAHGSPVRPCVMIFLRLIDDYGMGISQGTLNWSFCLKGGV